MSDAGVYVLFAGLVIVILSDKWQIMELRRRVERLEGRT